MSSSAQLLPPLSSLGPLAVVAPHPDDETLGCGGLLACCADQRVRVVVVAVTDGEASHPGSTAWPPPRLAARRRHEQREALDALGHPAAPIHRLGLPDGGLATLGREAWLPAVLRLRSIVTRCRSVFVTAPDDDHPDHAAAARLVREATEDRPRLVYYYAVWPPAAGSASPEPASSPASPRRRWVLPLGPALERKRRALAAFGSQRGEGIDDDPDGFRMPPSLLARATAPEEWFHSIP